MNPAVSVVIPVRDEADNIEGLVAEVVAVLEPQTAFEIIAVDDGSRDATPARLRALRERFGIRVLVNPRSLGQSTATWLGVRAAHSDLVVTIDGDGQNDPADIPLMLRALKDNPAAALVMGYRRARLDRGVKRLSSRVANHVRRAVLRDDNPDSACGLKLFRRDDYLALPYFDHMHRFVPALIRRSGGTVLQVAVNHRRRTAGRSKYGTLDRLAAGIIDLFGVYWLAKRYRLPGKPPQELP